MYKYIPQIPQENNYGMQKTRKEPGFVDVEQEETQASTLTQKVRDQMNSKSEKTSTIFSISKSAFQRFFQIGKRPLYAQVMAKKLTATPKMHLSEKLQTLS